jgi:hypothetical protein
LFFLGPISHESAIPGTRGATDPGTFINSEEEFTIKI